MANKQLIIDADYPVPMKVMALIQCISHELEAEMKRMLKPFNISNTQLMILHELDKHVEDKMTVNEIKARMVDDSPNVSRSLNALMTAGLIEKTRDEKDQRVVWISITEAGINMHHEVDKVMMTNPKNMPLNAEEMQQCYELLKKF